MPPKRNTIGRSTPQARKKKALRASETDEQREARLETHRVRMSQARSSETDAQRTARLETARVRSAQARSSETREQREARLETVRVRIARSRRKLHADLSFGAFRYDDNYNYSLHPSVVIGKMKQNPDQLNIKLEMDMYSENESENEAAAPRKRKMRHKRKRKFLSKWVLEKKFPNEECAVAHLASEELWSIDPRRRYSIQGGRKVHYRCNKVRISGPSCSAWKCLYYPNNSKAVFLYTTNGEHTHDNIVSTLGGRKYLRRQENITTAGLQFRNPMEANLKIRIMELMKSVHSPREIMTQLEEEGFDVSSRRQQVRNYFAKLRREKNCDKWIIENTFDSMVEAKLYLKQQKIWNFRFRNISQYGETYHYRCNIVPKDGPQCEARKYVGYNRLMNEAKLYRMNCPHTHDQILGNRSIPKSFVICDSKAESDWLLNQLNRDDRNQLIMQGFRVVAAVGLDDCLKIENDNEASFHDHLYNLQQKAFTNSDYQIKEEVLTDEEFTLPVEVNLYEGNDSYIKPEVDKRYSRKPLFKSDWVFEEKFPNEQLALERLAKDNLWNIDPRRVYAVTGGRKVHYRCNRVKINGPQCEAWKCLFYPLGSEEVTMYKKGNGHTHDDSIGIQYRSKLSNRGRKRSKFLPMKSGTIIRKRGRPFKFPPNNLKKHNILSRISTAPMNDNNCNNFPTNVSNDTTSKMISTKTINDMNQENTSPMEIELFAGDEQTKYVINFIDDEPPKTPPESVVEDNPFNRILMNNELFMKHNMENIDILPTLNDGLGSNQPNQSHLNWMCKKIFTKFQDAQAYVRKLQIWSIVTKTKSAIGGKWYYRCNLLRKSGPQCKARIYIFSCEKTKRYLFYRNSEPHTHAQVLLNSSNVGYQCSSIKNNSSPVELITPSLPASSAQNLEEIITSDRINNCFEEKNESLFQDGALKFTKNLKWVLEDRIPNASLVNEYLNKTKIWSSNYRQIGASKVYYRCNITKECEAQMCLLSKDQVTEILVYRSGEHCHGIYNEMPSYISETSNVIVKEELIIDDGSLVKPIDFDDAILDEPIEDNVNNNCGDDDDDQQMATAQKWSFEKKFATISEANKFLADTNGLWDIKSTTKHKSFYRCTYPCEPECPAHIFFLFENGCDEVLYFSGDPHNHPECNKLDDVEQPIISDSLAPEEIVICDSDTEESVPKPGSSRTVNKKRIKGASPEFKYTKKFTNLTAAVNYMNECGIWYLTCNRQVAQGLRKYFWCSYKDTRGTCTARVYLLVQNDSDEVLYFSAGEHLHDIVTNDIPTSEIQMSTEIIKETNKETEDFEIIISDSDADSINGHEVENNMGSGEEWSFEKKFEDYKMAKSYLKSLNLWSFKSTISTRYGVKEYYNCNPVNEISLQCPASKYLLYEDINNEVLLYNRTVHHTFDCVQKIPPLVPIQINSENNIINLVDSDDDEIELNGGSSEPSTSFGNPKKWILEKKFETSQQAIDFLRDKRIWSYKHRIESKLMVKEYYRCNLVRRNGPQCDAEKFLLFNNSTNQVHLYQTEASHTHDHITKSVFSLPEVLDDETKRKIKELHDDGNTPKQILAMLQLERFKMPTRTQLYSYLAKIRRNIVDTVPRAKSFIRTIELWLSQNASPPAGEDITYCVNFHVDYKNNAFRCFLSTKRLLSNALSSEFLHMDSSCTLYWQKNPLTIVGTSDLDQKFHLIGVAVCAEKNETDFEFIFKSIKKGVFECHNQQYKPKTLIVDNCEAIHNAFIRTFGIETQIVMCSTVALCDIFVKLSASVECNELKAQIKDDIIKIQTLSSPVVFRQACKLFTDKWRILSGKSLYEFLNYFQSNWISKNWFQGFLQFTPSTNKAITSEFYGIKTNYAFKENISLTSFRYHLQIMIEQWSLKYETGAKTFIKKPTIPMALYQKAIEWNNLQKQMKIEVIDEETLYYIPAGKDRWICDTKLQKYKNHQYNTLDELFDTQFSFWRVRLPSKGSMSCTCPYFMDNFLCKHSLGMASVLNLIEFPPTVKKIVLNLNKQKPDVVNFINLP